jgi:hypothetical protein
METETTAASASTRPRSWLLILLGIAVVAVLVMKLGGSATPTPPPSNPARPATTARGAETQLDPAALDVRLEALTDARPAPRDVGRNPFRFEPKPPPEPVSGRSGTPGANVPPPGPMLPPAPPPPPPIPLKFMGIIEAPGVGKIASLTDCRFTYRAREGELIEGRYRLVKIGVESIVIENRDGTGQTTLRMSGQECVK